MSDNDRGALRSSQKEEDNNDVPSPRRSQLFIDTSNIAETTTSAVSSAVRVRRKLHEFTTYTTHHGMYRLGSQTNLTCRLLWVVLLLATYSGLVYHVYTLISRYTKTPLLTGMSTSLHFEFPDVYLCPSNLLSLSKIVETYNSAEVLQLSGLKKNTCNTSCQIKLSKFDIEDQSALKPVTQSRLFQALMDNVAFNDKSLIGAFRLDYTRTRNLTECRHPKAGEKYTGNANTVSIIWTSPFTNASAAEYQNRPLVTTKPCMSWNNAARRLKSSGIAAAAAAGEAILALNFSDSENRCRLPQGLPLSKFAGFVSQTGDTMFEGPYCFFLDRAEQLSAIHCSIPFCPTPPEHDCIVSMRMPGRTVSPDPQEHAAYTGYVNVTELGHKCMPWRTVKEGVERGTLRLEKLAYSTNGNAAYKVIALHIQTADYSLSNAGNYCRFVHVMYDATIRSGGTTSYKREKLEISHSTDQFLKQPGCFHLDDEVENIVQFDPCKITMCYESSRSVTGSIRDTVGKALLIRQFSGGLTLGFADCRFYNKRCTRDDFVNVEHPELGVCHRFIKDRFLKGLSRAQVAEAKFQFKYFTDSSDSLGRKYKDMDSIMETTVRREAWSATDAETAMTVIVVPTGAYPWASRGIPVSSAQHTRVMLRYERTVRLSQTAEPCLKQFKPVIYSLNTWRTSPSNLDTSNSLLYANIHRATTWAEKTEALRQTLKTMNDEKKFGITELQFASSTRYDCVNALLVRKFIANCDCLPSFLPIPADLAQSKKRCFNQTDTDILLRVERCTKRQVDSFDEDRAAAFAECLPPCETCCYSVREVTHPWPILKRERSLGFLEQLARMYGYPNDIASRRGIVSLYYAYLRARELSKVPPGLRNATDVIDFEYEIDIVRDRLAMVTVHADRDFGEEIIEDVAYPFKNLIADVGGALGFWCGLSILTLCEVIELSIILLLALRCRATALVRRVFRLSSDPDDAEDTDEPQQVGNSPM